MKIVVTGSSGYLGSRLVVELEGRGHHVLGWDRIDGHPDLVNIVVPRMIKDISPDAAVHLAGMPGRLFCESKPALAVHENVEATANIAKACADNSIRFVFCSTSEVYGRSERCTESDIPSPINIYGMTNYWAEQLCQRIAPEGLAIMRPTMPYSGDMQVGYGRCSLATFIYNALNEQPSVVHRNTSRSWCYADDVIRGMADVIESGEGIYNIGRDDDQRETASVAWMVYEKLGLYPDRYLFFDDPDETVTCHKILSTERLRELGWSPRIDLEEGIMLSAAAMDDDRLQQS